MTSYAVRVTLASSSLITSSAGSAAAAGSAAIVATHDNALIELADRVLELKDGKLVSSAGPTRTSRAGCGGW